MSADMEMSCDERVIREIGEETKRAYSMSLLSLAAERRIIAGSPLAFGEGGMKERIKNVLHFKKPSRMIVIAAVALAAALTAGLVVNRAADDAPVKPRPPWTAKRRRSPSAAIKTRRISRWGA
jgi:beta-lactamase regulating signal transducer with metallopeptidase domain